MSIKGIFRSVFGTFLLSLILLAFLAVSLAHRQQELNATQIRRAEALRLLQEMRNARDYLTQFSRGYVHSGNERYIELYESVSDIWDGKRSRPVYLDETYWDILSDSTSNKVRMRPAISFTHLVDEAGFTPEERSKINEAMELSQEMTRMEEQAFRDYARTKDWSGGHHIIQDPARFEYLTSDAYNQLRLTFKQDYARIFAAINDRANGEIMEIENRNWYLLYAILSIVLLLCGIVFGAYRMMLSRVILPILYLKRQTNSLEKDLDSLVQVTRAIASGTLDAKFVPKTELIDFPSEDEIGHLVHVHNGMLNHMKESGSLIAEVAVDLKKSHEEAASADRAKSEFLANMTHEIRTPMNAIIGFSELLVAKVRDPVLRNYTEGIRVGSKNLLQLINDILDLSKIESGYLEIKQSPFQLAVLQRELMQMFSEEAKQKGVNLSFSKAPDSSSLVHLDESRLRQVLINLIGNALKFTSQGFVHVEFRLCASKDNTKGELLIRVQDTGIGIARSDFERIFQAFSQAEGQSNRKYAGTGLGLTISRRLVELMGGRIDVDSIRGQGSCFSLVFPNIRLQCGKTLPVETIEPKERTVFLPATIVIGEDVESNLELLTAYLEPHPFRIYSASDGQSVLNLVRKHNPDMLLLDLQMPVIDGKEVLKILREDPIYKELSIVVLTASAPYENDVRWEHYCNAIIRKPLRGSELFRELRKFLNFKMESLEVTEEAGEAWPSLGDDSRRQLQILLEQTEAQLHGGMDLDHIESVSRKVYELAQKETHRPLENCAVRLLEAIEDFNTLLIKSLFEEIKFRSRIASSFYSSSSS